MNEITEDAITLAEESKELFELMESTIMYYHICECGARFTSTDKDNNICFNCEVKE